jgi:hypothetical protein
VLQYRGGRGIAGFSETAVQFLVPDYAASHQVLCIRLNAGVVRKRMDCLAGRGEGGAENGYVGGGSFSVVIENLASFLRSPFLRDRFAREAKRLFGIYRGGGGSDGALAQNP